MGAPRAIEDAANLIHHTADLRQQEHTALRATLRVALLRRYAFTPSLATVA